MEPDDDFVARVEQKHAAAVDGEYEVIARQLRATDAVRLEHCREMSRPDRRRARHQLMLDLHHHHHHIRLIALDKTQGRLHI